MTEFSVKRQSAQAVARAQGPWMRLVGDNRLDDLSELPRTAANSGAEAIA